MLSVYGVPIFQLIVPSFTPLVVLFLKLVICPNNTLVLILRVVSKYLYVIHQLVSKLIVGCFLCPGD